MSNKVVKIIGKVESGERFLRIALYQVSCCCCCVPLLPLQPQPGQ